ncbi:hypothetical protein ACVNP3_20850 [Pseudomonas chlororaphis subsp. piscium]
MPDTDSLTLRRLLSLKQRREQSLRAALSALARQENQLQDSIAGLLQQRRQLQHQWRECCEVSQVLDHRALRDLKIELAQYHQQDHAMTERLEALHAEQQRIRGEQAQGQIQLRKLLVEQEKLNWLLE